MNKGYTADQLLWGQFAPLLTGLSKQKWFDCVLELHVPPSINDLLAFLSKRVDATQEDELVENLAFARPIPSNKPFAKKKEKRQGSVLRVQDSALPNFYYCHQGHFICLCPTLNGQSVEQRNESVRQKRLCFNCLSANHIVSNCTSKCICKECGRKHHSMLHKQSAPPPSPADDPVAPVLRSKQNYPTNSVLLETALVSISTGNQHQRTRAVHDSGAAMCLITSRLSK